MASHHAPAPTTCVAIFFVRLKTLATQQSGDGRAPVWGSTVLAMSTLEAALLGIVQGLFMFIPVSSTSHLALVQNWLISRGSPLPPPDSPEMILFDLVVHVGTLLSIVVVMRRPLARLVRGIWRDVFRGGRGLPVRRRLHLRLAVLGMVTVAVTGVLGFPIRAYGTDIFAAPTMIAVTLIVTGGILWWTDHAGPARRGVMNMTVAVAIGIGVAQGLALLPGLSRSGLTIAMALLLGLQRPIAAQYSFFVAIPTILAASGVQALEVLGADASVISVSGGAFAVGFVVAAVVGAGALIAVLKLLDRARFRVFSFYVWALAAFVLIVG